MPKYRCEVAIPTRGLFSGDVDYAKIPGVDGDFGVLSGHESFVGLNRDGILTLWMDADGKERVNFLISGGCTQVLNNHLSVLPRFGCEVSTIDLDDVNPKIEKLQGEIAQTESEFEASEGEEREALESTLRTMRERLAWYELKAKTKTSGAGL